MPKLNHSLNSPSSRESADSEDITRREAFRQAGRYAAYTAPVMLSLMVAKSAAGYGNPGPTPSGREDARPEPTFP